MVPVALVAVVVFDDNSCGWYNAVRIQIFLLLLLLLVFDEDKNVKIGVVKIEVVRRGWMRRRQESSRRVAFFDIEPPLIFWGVDRNLRYGVEVSFLFFIFLGKRESWEGVVGWRVDRTSPPGPPYDCIIRSREERGKKNDIFPTTKTYWR